MNTENGGIQIYRKTVRGANESNSGEAVILTVEQHGGYALTLINDFADHGELLLDFGRDRNLVLERAVDMAIWPIEKLLARGVQLEKVMKK